MKVVTSNPIIIDDQKVSPEDYYLNISGSDTRDLIREFQSYANSMGHTPKLTEDGMWSAQTAAAAVKYGKEFDKQKGKGQFWDKAKGAWEKVQQSGLLQSIANLLSTGKKPDTNSMGSFDPSMNYPSVDTNKKSNNGMKIALAVGAVVLVGVIIFVAMKKKNK